MSFHSTTNATRLEAPSGGGSPDLGVQTEAMKRHALVLTLLVGVGFHPAGCANAEPEPTAGAGEIPAHGLLVALSQFEVSPEGKVLPKPKAALLEILVPRRDAWEVIPIEDPDSNVFHKAMAYDPGGEKPAGILTLGGTEAVLKLWRKGPQGFTAETLWRQDFGGKFSRMREAEILPLGEGRAALAVATHDQGVVATGAPGDDDWTVRERDRKPSTIVHEIEVGDLDGDGEL
jgi:hypothetical protein